LRVLIIFADKKDNVTQNFKYMCSRPTHGQLMMMMTIIMMNKNKIWPIFVHTRCWSWAKKISTGCTLIYILTKYWQIFKIL